MLWVADWWLGGVHIIPPSCALLERNRSWLPPILRCGPSPQSLPFAPAHSASGWPLLPHQPHHRPGGTVAGAPSPPCRRRQQSQARIGELEGLLNKLQGAPLPPFSPADPRRSSTPPGPAPTSGPSPCCGHMIPGSHPTPHPRRRTGHPWPHNTQTVLRIRVAAPNDGVGFSQPCARSKGKDVTTTQRILEGAYLTWSPASLAPARCFFRNLTDVRSYGTSLVVV